MRKKNFDENIVLERAVNLFSRKGYNATTAQDMVDELGISRSSLYDTFIDKRTIFIKSLKRYEELTTDILINMLEAAKNPERAINLIFHDTIQQSVADNSLKGCLMVNTTVELVNDDKEIADIVRNNNQKFEAALAKIIEKGQEEGSFSKRETAATFAHFISGIMGALRLVAKSGANKKTMEDIVKVGLFALK
ncbi:TetR/AcrR family transcriptional regulator [Mucilaginibacter sp. McL0603]|uniref:TetR/AcrR family transcriptional regulator n=1 Tax=Mucilaginibacter sp. McL0603 TaxID=3415670 RepID=UPI003CF03DD4